MPELPEVETIVRELCQDKLVGCKIIHVDILWPKIVDSSQFVHEVTGHKITAISRRGKYIVIQLDHGFVLVHLRMTGKIFITPSKEIPRKHVHLQLHLSDGRVIHYEDQRKFGRWLFSEDIKKLSGLGLEPLSKEFTLRYLQELLLAHKSQIKPFLLNQRFIAGLGNIYVDEALWEAQIHPQSRTNVLSEKQIAKLHKAIKNVLERGIANSGTSLGSHRGNYVSVSGKRGGNQYRLNAFRQEGLPCPRCGTTIVKTTVAQRGTHFCPHCQQLHRPAIN